MIQREGAQTSQKPKIFVGWVPKVALEGGLKRIVYDFISQTRIGQWINPEIYE
jgi:hypothetical protein